MSEKKIALVTGANKGIGHEIVRQLAAKGMKVLLGARDAAKGREAAAKLQKAGLDVDFVQIDVASGESIRNAAAVVEKHHRHLDVLVNNAGILKDWGVPCAETPERALLDTFQTNVIGPWQVMRAFLPLLRKSPAARIVNVSSTLGSLAETGDAKSPLDANRAPVYSVSKTALNGITVQFARELRDTPIKVNSVCPGWVKTDMGSDAAPRTVEQGAAIAVKMATLGPDGPTGGFFDDGGVVAW